MKLATIITGILLWSQFSQAHGVHALVTSYSKSTVDAFDAAIHNAGYAETDFDDLMGLSSIQDVTRKIRVVRYRFSTAQCAKDLEVYFKLDGTSYLSHKVVGCVQ